MPWVDNARTIVTPVLRRARNAKFSRRYSRLVSTSRHMDDIVAESSLIWLNGEYCKCLTLHPSQMSVSQRDSQNDFFIGVEKGSGKELEIELKKKRLINSA